MVFFFTEAPSSFGENLLNFFSKEGPGGGGGGGGGLAQSAGSSAYGLWIAVSFL